LSTVLGVAIAYYCLIDPHLAIAMKLLGRNLGHELDRALLTGADELNLGLLMLEGGLLSALVGRIPFPKFEPSRDPSAEILQTVADSRDAVYLLDRQWQFRYVNAQGAAYLQTPPADLLEQQALDFLPQHEDSVVYQALQRSIETKTPAQFEAFCLPSNLWLEMQAYPTRDGIAVFAHDITARKQLEAERDQLLRREQAVRTTAEQAEQRSAFLSEVSKLLNAALDEASIKQAAQAIVPFLADGCLIFAIEAGRLRPLAIAAADSVQQSQLEAFAAQYQQRSPSRNLTQMLPAGLLEEESVCGTLFDVDAEAIALCEAVAPQACLLLPLTAHERTLGMMQLVRASAYTAAEMALAEELARRTAIAIDNAQLYRQARMLNHLKDEFLSTLSHELRTPLNVISGWTQLLQMQQYDAMTNQAIDTIDRNASLQAQIIDDLLDASHVITGRIQLQPVSTDLGAIVWDVIESLGVTAEAKAIALSYTGEAIDPLSLDPRYIRQAIWNLLTNAIKFTSFGGRVEIRLEVETKDRRQKALEKSLPNPQPPIPNPNVCLTITDTGIGIHPEFLPYVFDRFRQEDGSTTRHYGGVGLGLAIVRHIVELHGGSIHAESAGVGKGATFTLLLPRSDR
ncbi:MAG: PAS domain-containing protein, partial [Microcoleus sp. SIO2G3]|nr:PAS domain-containing protein [Microcoleus sp. SIO2G3]